MGGTRRRVVMADLEAMLGEFDNIEHSGDLDPTVAMHLLQVRHNARIGMPLEEWASAKGLPLTYAKALQRFIDQM